MPAKRILDFVRDRRRHLTQRRQPVAEPLAFLELFNAGEVLEEERRTGDVAVRISHLRQRVSDDLPGAFQPELGAVRQMGQIERPGHDA